MKTTLFVLLVFSFFALPAFAWHTNTHYQMTRDAVSLMPPDLQQVLTSNKRFVEEGIKDPDLVLRDWPNHYYIPSNPPQGQALDRIEKIIKIVNTKLQGSNQVDIGKQFYYLAHYIGDLWSPENVVNKSDTNSNMDFVNNQDLVILFEGYSEPIQNYHDYFLQRTNWRWTIENTDAGARILYDEAVNDIARVWLSIWQQAGHSVEHLPIRTISHKKGVLNVNYARMMYDEWQRVEYHSDWTENEDVLGYADRYANHMKDMDRYRSNIAPTSDEELAKAEVHNQQQWMNRLTPEAPFEMMETSLKTVNDKAYLVARFRNKIQKEIPSVAFMYPGVKGPVALFTKVQPGEVIKVEAVLPPNADRQKIQMVYANLDQPQ
jgi:hypothetical protein